MYFSLDIIQYNFAVSIISLHTHTHISSGDIPSFISIIYSCIVIFQIIAETCTSRHLLVIPRTKQRTNNETAVLNLSNDPC